MEEDQNASSASRKGTKMILGIGMGIALGVALGVAMENIGAGVAIGVAMGAGIGTVLRGQQDQKK